VHGAIPPGSAFEEVKSWLQNDVYDTSDWEMFDEEGGVDISSQRDPRDGERYVLLSSEGSADLRDSMETRFKKFLQTTRWRRLKSRQRLKFLRSRTIFQDSNPLRKQFVGNTFDTVRVGSRNHEFWLNHRNPVN
jgi:hypothetical protein